MKFAIKCSYVEMTGVGGLAVAKDPITDKGKRNKPGRLKLVKDDAGNYRTLNSIDHREAYEKAADQLVTVFENGKLICEYTFESIRVRCDVALDRIGSMETMWTDRRVNSN